MKRITAIAPHDAKSVKVFAYSIELKDTGQIIISDQNEILMILSPEYSIQVTDCKNKCE